MVRRQDRDDSAYLEWADSELERVPGTELRPLAEFETWLKEAVPVIVRAKIVNSRAVKSCSTVSPAFAKASVERGFPVFVRRVPGHVVNVALTLDGPVQVDLSHAQFKLPKIADQLDWDDKDPYGERRATAQILDEIKSNPFSTVEVKPLPKAPIVGLYAVGKEETFSFDDAKRYAFVEV